MQRHYPLNPATGNEDASQLPWKNGVPSTGTEGSYPPYQLCVDPQEEILAVITGAGITPNEANLAQLLAAIITLIPEYAPTAPSYTASLGVRKTSNDFELDIGSLPGGLTDFNANDYLAFLTSETEDSLPAGNYKAQLGPFASFVLSFLRQSGVYIPQGGYQPLTASGTFTVPDGVFVLFVKVWGAGGGGGGCSNNASTSGGGGGGYTEGYINVQPGDTISYVIGGGGGHGFGSSSGSSGGTSSFGSFMTATGGGGGQFSGGGVNTYNAPGGTGSGTAQSVTGGGSEGGIGSSTNYGGGCGGASYGVSISAGGGSNSPGAGGNYPGGGGAGAASNSGGNQAGGDGANGLITVEY